MKIEPNIDTKFLLMLESVGGLLTSGKYPEGLNFNSELTEWFTKFPTPNTELIVRWYDYLRAKYMLENYIKELSNKDA